MDADSIREMNASEIQRHIDDVAAGKLQVVIDSTFPLRDAAKAHQHIEDRKAFGRVVLIP